MKKLNASQLRQRIAAALLRLPKFKNELCTRKPMVKGLVYEMKSRCGKTNCRCMKGKLHKRLCLSWSEEGRTRLKLIKKDEVIKDKWLTGNYRRFRRSRAEFSQLCKEILELANQLELLMRGDRDEKTKRKRIRKKYS